MHPEDRHTAILYFSRSAGAEMRAKQWHTQLGSRFALKALNKLILHTKGIARSTSFPVFHVNERNQCGNCFEERLYHALEAIFSKGYKKVIAIGNDCSNLSVQDLELAAQTLDTHDLVTGATQKGGIYLLGITQKTFGRPLLQKINWESAAVFESIQNIKGIRLYTLTPKKEFHTFRELIHLLKQQQISPSLTVVASQLIQTFYRSISNQFAYPTAITLSALIQRGPPAY